MILDCVRSVLTALDEQGIADHGDDWPTLLADRFAVLEERYKHLTVAGHTLLDYSDLATQAAYVFRYVLCRAEFAYEVFRRARAQANGPLFDATELWVTSLGGGPGSELLGLIKYLQSEESEPEVSKIVYTVIDKESNWKHVTELLVGTIDRIEIELHYFDFDVTDNSVPTHITLHQEDLCMMSFFISEVCALPQADRVKDNLRDVLATMPAKSVLLYDDSKAATFISFCKQRVGAAGKFVEIAEVDETLICSFGAFDGIFEEYIDDYDYRPHLTSKALAKVYRRSK